MTYLPHQRWLFTLLTVTVSGRSSVGNMSGDRNRTCSSWSVSRVSWNQTINSHADTDSDSDTDGDMYRGLAHQPVQLWCECRLGIPAWLRSVMSPSSGTSRVALWGWYVTISDFLAIVVLKARDLNIEEANMAASAISNLLRKNVGAGLARVSLNKNIIRNYFNLVFSVDKRAFKRRVWFDFNLVRIHQINPELSKLIQNYLNCFLLSHITKVNGQRRVNIY